MIHEKQDLVGLRDDRLDMGVDEGAVLRFVAQSRRCRPPARVRGRRA
ncbi:MAG: hypothetical protein M5U09_21430 [Gammaproteobacteria bacterium]|nr:hypothetical protein [Gammaproteobacteria bacterium]